MRFFILLVAVVIINTPYIAYSEIVFTNNKWVTTYDCPEWKLGDAWDCDGIDIPTSLAVCTTLNEEVTSAANNPLGIGRGQRHFVDDGVAVNTSGTNIRFATPQKELWIRFYMRYEAGWVWNTMEQHKLIYMKTSLGNDAVFKFQEDSAIEVISLFTSLNAFPRNLNFGWADVMNGSVGDGIFHEYEIYLKMDTDGTDGIGRIWVDGILRAENIACNWSDGTAPRSDGWTYFNVGSNQAVPNNGGCVALDYDDITVINSSTSPTLKDDGNGNLFIGTIPTASTTPTSLAGIISKGVEHK